MREEPVHVFLIGAKGLGGYGGYETFVKKLIDHQPMQVGDRALLYHVFCKANGYGASDERTLPGVERLDENTFRYRNAVCHKLRVPQIGSAQAIVYDLRAVRCALHLCRRIGIRRPVFYILSCKLGPVIARLTRQIHDLGGVFCLNPDGQEWRREKWNRAVQAYLKYSEEQMARRADLVICDSRAIQEDLCRRYALPVSKTVFLAYGAELDQPETAEEAAGGKAWLREHGLEPGGYYLMVCRFVPENSFELILREFMASHTERKLLILTTENQAYRSRLENALHFEQDSRICLAGPVYEEWLLRQIRCGAWGYLHGHTVGGTNPGLLEAMATTELSLVRDVSFNREVAGEAALYWTGEPGSLRVLLQRADAMTEEERAAFGREARLRIRRDYQWDAIAAQYQRLFLEEVSGDGK